MKDPRLWQRLAAHHLPDAVQDALHAEAGWTQADIHEAQEEYLRFLYLTQISPEPLTPATPINRVWHMHLTHAPGDWQRLAQILPRAPGPATETEAFDTTPRYFTRYDVTRTLYKSEFEIDPPEPFWPSGRGVEQRDPLPGAAAFALLVAVMSAVAMVAFAAPAYALGVILGGAAFWAAGGLDMLRARRARRASKPQDLG